MGFSTPAYVDKDLHGGEPLLWEDTIHHTLLYTAHEGTTHLYRPGFNSITGDFTFVDNYRNQVILWVSKDDGKTWTRINYQGTGFSTDPTKNTGFSDPDFTQDAGGRVYDTGIDLANDALFSSPDGGITWDRGTVQCNDGDRPWLAGGNKDEVFMSTDTVEDGFGDPTGTGHSLFQSKDGGNTCQKVATDYGTTDKGGTTAYVGYGKLFMDHARQRIIEPELYQGKDESGNTKTLAIGAGTWKRGDSQFAPHFIGNTTLQGHFPIIALDSNDTAYLFWDTDPRDKNGKDGCGGGPTPLANSIQMTVSKDFGQTWSAPVTISAPAGARVLWPWAVAGDPGKVGVVWYQSNKVNDPDCAGDDVKWSIYETHIEGADNPATMRVSPPVDAAGAVIHTGGICQGGTTCVATGQDRRLGDFFTNAIDARGCEIIASGDTRLTDEMGNQLPTARPIFIRQSSGPPLIGSVDCSGSASQVLANRNAAAKKKAKRKRTCRAHRRRSARGNRSPAFTGRVHRCAARKHR
ncbi:MAG: hypothetical protein ACJ76Z_12060 [Thermoleophilaceae bacterium]